MPVDLFSKQQLELQVQLGCHKQGIFFFMAVFCFIVHMPKLITCVLVDPCLGYYEQHCHEYRHTDIHPLSIPTSVPLSTYAEKCGGGPCDTSSFSTLMKCCSDLQNGAVVTNNCSWKAEAGKLS